MLTNYKKKVITQTKIMRISIIGNGNLAQSIAQIFFKTSQELVEMYAPNFSALSVFCKTVNAQPLKELSKLNTNIDILIIAITDSAIRQVVTEIPKGNFVLAHTSGSIAMDVFEEANVKNYGVFYPLYSFLKAQAEDFSEIPIMLESVNETSNKWLHRLANKLSNNISVVNSQDRKKYHMAGILVNNFTNHLWAICQEMLDNSGLAFENLKPILKETANNAMKSEQLYDLQTGPAKRNNQKIINSHIELLEDNKDLQELYQCMTRLITKKHNK